MTARRRRRFHEQETDCFTQRREFGRFLDNVSRGPLSAVQSRKSSFMPVFDRVRSSTRFTMTAQ